MQRARGRSMSVLLEEQRGGQQGRVSGWKGDEDKLGN